MTAPDESDTPKAAGKVLHVGELTVNGEMLTGYFVQATVEEIRALKTVPIYQRVVLVPVRELASRALPPSSAPFYTADELAVLVTCDGVGKAEKRKALAAIQARATVAAARVAQADAMAKALEKMPGICAAWADALESKGLTDSARSVKLSGREARDLLRAYADSINPQTKEKIP